MRKESSPLDDNMQRRELAARALQLHAPQQQRVWKLQGRGGLYLPPRGRQQEGHLPRTGHAVLGASKDKHN